MKKMRLVVALGVALTAGCHRQAEEAYAPGFAERPAAVGTVLSFGVHPLHNPQRLFEVYGPIAADLSSHVAGGVKIRLEASRSYADFERKLYGRRFHFALPNPVQTLRSLEHGYRIFGKMGDDERFRGILIVRRDSGIERVEDLKGKVVAFPAPTALAATLMPLEFLRSKGLDVTNGIRRLYCGSQESSIMSVYLRQSAAGATWPIPWEAFVARQPEQAKELVVKWETPPLVNNGLVVRDDVPAPVAAAVAARLFALHRDEAGRRLLAAVPISHFEPATEETYAPVRRFLARYPERVE